MPRTLMPNEWPEERKEALLGSINLLIRSPEAHSYLAALDALYPVAKTHPVRLNGVAALLNPLLEVRLVNDDLYERMLDLVDAKRRDAGYDRLRAKHERFDKTEYMRHFMAAKRERLRRAAAIENMLRPERDRLIGRSRLDFMDRQAGVWKRELDRLIDRVRATHDDGRLSKDDLDTLRAQFWDGVDKYLDDLEVEARKTQGRPSRTLSFSMAQLQQALEANPLAPAA